MRVHGHEARQGETAFAFLVFRLQRPVTRTELVELIRHVASVIPDAEAFIEELPDEDPAEPVRIVGIPWMPPEAGNAAGRPEGHSFGNHRNGLHEAGWWSSSELEPTTKMLWNTVVSDQLILSDTRHRARRGPLLMKLLEIFRFLTEFRKIFA